MKILIGIAIIYLIICIGYYLFQEKIIFHPEKIAQDFNYQYPVPYEEHFLKTDDGVSINVVHAKTENASGVVLYFHGNAAHLYELGYVAGELASFGYDVLLMDYRSYGKSTGKLSEENLHKDARMCYNWLLEQYDPSQIIIYGRSIGTGVATKLASTVPHQKLVLESPYYSVIDLGQYYTPYLPYKLLVRYPLKSGEYIQKVTSPVFIIHGKEDKIVPFASGKKLAEATPNLGKFYELDYAGHNDLGQFDTYHKALADVFFNH
ncbi:MAG: alpha/beta hydrolase [Flammeovirgaceae bacterium]